MTGPKNKLGNIASKVAFYSSLGFILPGAIVGGAVFGYYLDRWLGTTPVLAIVMGALGAAAGFVEVFRLVAREERREGRNDTNDGTGKS